MVEVVVLVLELAAPLRPNGADGGSFGVLRLGGLGLELGLAVLAPNQSKGFRILRLGYR